MIGMVVASVSTAMAIGLGAIILTAFVATVMEIAFPAVDAITVTNQLTVAVTIMVDIVNTTAHLVSV